MFSLQAGMTLGLVYFIISISVLTVNIPLAIYLKTKIFGSKLTTLKTKQNESIKSMLSFLVIYAGLNALMFLLLNSVEIDTI